jgi:hypothetical protein
MKKPMFSHDKRVENHAISSKPLRNIRLIDDSKFETAATGRKFVMKDPQQNQSVNKNR